MKTIELANQLPISLISHEMLSSRLAGTVSNINNKIASLVRAGDLIRLKKGFYCFAPAYRKHLLDLKAIAGGLYAPSYLSFEYALSFHGVIPEAVYEMTSATTRNDKYYETPVGRFSYKKIPLQAYSLGVDWHFDRVEGGIFVATVEKALCDKIRYHRRLGTLSQRDMRDYLLDDMRADLPENMNVELIKTIAEAYRSRNLATLASVIERMTP